MFEDEPAMKPGLEECENAVIVPHIASATLWTRAGMVSASRWGSFKMLAGQQRVTSQAWPSDQRGV